MAVESIGGVYDVKIPGLTDSADIQNAFKAYHYGAYTSIATTAGIASGGMAYWLKGIEDDIALLEARPSSGGDATSSAPVAGDFTPSGIPDGYIWVDLDGAMTSNVNSSTAIYNNNAPTSGLTSGIIWVDKDATTSTTGNPFIPQAIIAAKGDLIAGISNDTVTVLTVGSDGQYLKADSSTTSGLAWAAPGDLTAVSAGTGITVTNGAGPIPSVAVDDTLVATTSNTMTLSNKTLTAPTLNNPSVTSGTFIAGTFTSAPTINNPTVSNGTFTNPILIAPEERLTVTAASATGTINIDTITSGTLYYTSSASSNHVINVRHSSNTSLNNILTTGDSITVVWLNTNGATAFYPTVLTVDGATSGVSVKWQGGTAPSSGNASSVDAYVYNIIKTAATSYTVLASQTKFA
jgi:hypothetical protein